MMAALLQTFISVLVVGGWWCTPAYDRAADGSNKCDHGTELLDFRAQDSLHLDLVQCLLEVAVKLSVLKLKYICIYLKARDLKTFRLL